MYVGILDDIFCASEALCLVHLIISFYLFIRLDNFKFADSFFCHLRYAIESTKWIFITVTVFLNSRFSIWFLFIISIFWLIFSVQWLIVTIFSFYSLNMDSFSSLNNIYFFLFLILTRGYLLIWERERERERETLMWEKHRSVASCTLPYQGVEPTIQVCALTGNWPHRLLVYRMAKQLNHLTGAEQYL